MRTPQDWLCVVLIILTSTQVILLHAQSTRANKWVFLPKSLRTTIQYDYFQPQGNVVFSGLTDCAICMTPVTGEVVNTSPLMYAPCGHVFHSDCLTNWMRIKLECPNCRQQLPPWLEDDDR